MAVNIHFHCSQSSQPAVTVNIFPPNHENDQRTPTQLPTQLIFDMHRPDDPPQRHGVRENSHPPSLPPPTESDINATTKTPGGVRGVLKRGLTSAKWKQWHKGDPRLSLKRRLMGGIFYQSQVKRTVDRRGGGCSRENRSHKAAGQNFRGSGQVSSACPPKSSDCCFPASNRQQPTPESDGVDGAGPNCVVPAVLPVREPLIAGNNPRVREYRSLELIVQMRNGKVDYFFATMDTGADLNMMTATAAAELGYEPGAEKRGTIVGGIEEHVAVSMGTVQIPFWLRCDSNQRSAEFHIVHDLAGHRALLSVQLTMKLGHLPRPQCEACDNAVLGSASS
ncbi:hypothetical protein Z517_01480 [Fonsecaea pedrosoi CBS 271.37]|uniref:Uncharacterized protein n=1 Tax=Fonsecaea pedrosoi CBS 271.37 TaxID=1442368 RepID=A0A0D2E7N0_9EURO|nr:uncharacterized protein Z517_01480 [Fonsecaea pedrosoi CBS 271.37]KIW86086.1 hypothetical protein Z517_01480 [Fonsecaea pedrosoi CBS 271.37]